MCDPVIDEHFRRSLGERYTHLFASSPASSSLAAADSSSHPSTESKTLASTVNVTGLSGNQSGRLYRFSSPPPSDANEKLPSRKSTSSLTNLLNSAIFIFQRFQFRPYANLFLFLFTVDDHFAKALGETWLKLQNETNKDKEVSVNSDAQPQQPDSPLPSQRPKLILT